MRKNKKQSSLGCKATGTRHYSQPATQRTELP